VEHASPLSAWESFYVIVGSSAAALTGLQFVVMALVAESQRASSSHEVNAFGTPTVVHFSAVLLVSAILSAPWHDLEKAALFLGMSGASGVAYVLLVIWRARRQEGYKPVLEDWLFHAVFPFICYAALFAAALLLPNEPETPLFVIGAAALFLVFIGIHNSWDTVTYVAVERGKQGRESPE
jgi:hypothetical protein